MDLWQTALILTLAGLSISRIADVVNQALSTVVPGKIPLTSLTGTRVVLWIVAAIFGFILVNTLEYDPLKAVGIAEGAAKIWNILTIMTATDVADTFFRGRLLRAEASTGSGSAD